MILRPARQADSRALAAILGDWVRETGWMPLLHTREEDLAFVRGLTGRGLVTVADDDGPQGFLAREGEEVLALYLAPSARGRGLGRILLDRAKAESPRLGLWTFERNEGARRFYAREGFAEVNRTDGDNEEGLPDVRLAWELRWEGRRR